MIAGLVTRILACYLKEILSRSAGDILGLTQYKSELQTWKVDSESGT